MILQALYEYYRRKPELPQPGFEIKEIPFLIVLTANGEFFDLEDTREPSGKKLIGKKYLVPKEIGRSGANAWMTTNLLWDHYGYVLGHPKSDSRKDVEMACKQRKTFADAVQRLQKTYPDNKDLAAVVRFLTDDLAIASVFTHRNWADCSKTPGCNLTFRISGMSELICENEDVRDYLSKTDEVVEEEELQSKQDNFEGVCLISGEISEIARLHPRTPIPGAKSNAKLVSFQKNMGFDSYGKEQNYNAPVGKRAAFAYTTALNHLLSKDSKQRLQVGDASTVFWGDQANPMEDLLADLFSEPPRDDPDRNAKAIESLYKAPKTGAPAFDDDGTRFYVLGLAPNAARIAVRFWHVATVSELAGHIKQHFHDLEIVHGPHEKPYLSLFRLLISTAIQGKSENIAPNLAGDFMKSILVGMPYPQTLLQAVIRRTRAEREISYPRAALVKACLNRQIRYSNPDNAKELAVALDDTQTNIGYRLGRLFAVLEKIQEEANPGINATIRDRYYGAASSTPVAVFQTLMRLKNHHLAKLENRGRAVNLERLIGEIVEGIHDFPRILSLPDQGRFTIGYYHQRQTLFTKAEKS